jgi:hypothetical protein
MFSPESLRKRSREVEEILESQRREEETKRLREENERRLEEERHWLVHAEREKYRKLTDSISTLFVRSAIKEAAKGGRSAEVIIDSIPVSSEAESWLIDALHGMGFDCDIQYSSKYWSKLSNLVNKTITRVSSVPGSEGYRRKFLDAMERQDEQRLLELSHDICRDKSIAIRSSDEVFIKLHLIRHLQREAHEEVSRKLCGTWTTIDVVDARLSDFHQVPSWLTSTGGAGLLERMSNCFQRDADCGRRETNIQLSKLPIIPCRWGENMMTKFTCSGEPIGVSPFTDLIMAKTLTVLGFETSLEQVEHTRVLKISW